MEKLSVTFFILVLMFISITAVSAADEIISTDNLQTVDDINIVTSDDTPILKESEDLAFDELNKSISGLGDNLVLTNNYTFSSEKDNDYKSGIIIDKSITIDGNGYTIDAKNSARIFYINASNVVLKNLIIINGNSDDGNGGGAIFISSYANNVSIDNSTFSFNKNTGSGGSIWWEGDNGTVTSSKFNNNYAGDTGGAIFWFGDDGLINNTNFDSNNATANAGAVAWVMNGQGFGGHNGKIINSNFTNNNASENGGAIYWVGLRGVIDESLFDSNYASKWGGAIRWVGSDGIIEKSLFDSNNASENGGAITVDGSNLQIKSSTLNNNEALIHGGSIYWAGINGNITNSKLNNNKATYQGGAVIWLTENGKIFNSEFSNNNAFNGGAIFWIGNAGLIGNSTFEENFASESGAAIYWNGQTATIISSTFIKNKDAVNGAFFTDGETGKIINSTFLNNTVGVGGAVYIHSLSSNYEILGSIFLNNKASTGTGDAIVCLASGCKINNSILISKDSKQMVHATGLGSDFVADYNWWGNTNLNYQTNDNAVAGIELNNWLFLNISAETNLKTNETKEITISLNNLYDKTSISNYDNYELPEINLTITVTNGSSNVESIILEKGVSKLSFTPSEILSSVEASYEDINASIEFTIYDENSFTELKNIINADESTIELDKNYTFNSFIDKDLIDGINITKSIKINGNGNTINGMDIARIFNIQANDVVLNNIIFTKGKSEKGAINVNGSNTLISESQFIDNNGNGTFAGSIYIDGDANNTQIEKSIFINNTASINGGAIYWGGDNGKLTESEFINNKALSTGSGGAIFWFGDNGTISSTNFVNNTAKNNGGAVAWFTLKSDIGGHNGKIIDSNFTNNTAFKNGGALSWESPNGNIENINFINNTAINGGSLYWIGNEGNISSSKFSNNNAKKDSNLGTGSGAAIYWIGEKGTVSNSEFDDNNAESNGGAVFWEGNNGNITNATFKNGHAGKSGSAVFWQSNNGIISQSQFIDNQNAEAGTLFWFGNNGQLLSSNFTNNIAANGGAIYWFGSNGNITESIFINNKASSNVAGAIYGSGHNIIISKSEFKDNNATNGGSIYWEGIQLTISESIFTNNNATDAGAIFIASKAKNATITKSIFINNTASRSGDAILWLASDGKINNSIFISYEANYIVHCAEDGINLNADYNWWGNTNIDYDANERVYGATLNNWLFLNITGETIINIGDSVELSITLNNLYDKTSISEYNEYNLPNINISISSTNGTADYETLTLESGIAKLTFIPNETFSSIKVSYLNAESIANIISKSNITLNISIENVTYPNKAKAIIEVNVLGNYTLKINDEIYNITIDNNKFEYELKILDASEESYNATIIFNGDLTYNAAENTTSFKVNKDINSLNVTVEEVIYPGVANVYVYASVNGTYNVTVDGKDYSVEVKDGVGNVTIDLLGIGTYEVNVTFDNGNYTNLINSTTLTVSKGVNSLNVTVGETDSLTNATVYVYASVDGEYTVLVNGTSYTVNVKDNVGNVTIGLLDVGEYLVNLTFANANYTYQENSTNLKVKGVNSLNVSVGETSYPDNATVYVYASVDGNYTVLVNGTSYTVNVKDSVGNVTIDVLYVGEYVVNVTFANESYVNLENHTTLNVVSGANTLNVTVDETDVLTNATVYVYADVEGKYIVSVNGSDYEVEVKEGVGNTTIKLLELGNYTVTLTFDDKNYTNNDNSTILKIVPALNTLNVTVEETSYPNNATIFVEASVDGNYTFSVGLTPGLGSQNYEIEVIGGKANKTINILNIGEYLVTLTFDNENYTQNTNSTKFNVTKGSNTLSLDIPNVDSQTNATAHIAVSVDGKYTLTIGDDEYNITIENKAADITLKIMPIGNYTATLTFTDDVSRNYVNTTTTAEFRVAQSFNNLSVSIADITYGGNATAIISASVDGEYILTVNGTEYNVNVVDNKAEFNITNLAAGYYDVTLTLVNSEDYTESSNTTNFTVNKFDNKLNVTLTLVTYPEYVNATVVVNVNGNYTLTVNGVDYPVEITEYSKNITLELLNAGIYNATLRFSDDQNYTNHVNTTEFEVLKVNNSLNVTVDSINYGQNATVSIEADVLGNYTLVVNGEVVATVEVLDKKVEYTLTNLAAGDYEVNITFSDTVNYENPTNSTTFNVKPIEITLNMTNAEIFTYPNEVIINVSASVDGIYYITIGSEKYEVNVENHVGNLTLSLKVGKYTATLTYHDNVNFTGTNSTNFEVKKGTAIFNITINNVEYGREIVAVINSDSDGIYLITIPDTDNPFYQVNVKDGFGNVTIDKLPVGSYEATVSFTSTSNYETTSNSTTFTVTKANIELNVSVENITYGNDIVIKADANVDDTFNIQIGDKNYTLTIENGTGTTSISKLIVGNYTAILTSSDSKNYNEFEKEVNFTVSKSTEYTIKIISTPGVFGGNATVSITLPDDAIGIISIDGIYNDTLENGSAIIYIGGLEIGEYPINISYNGDDNYEGFTQNEELSIITSIYAGNTTRAYNSDHDFQAVLSNVNGGELENENVTVTVDGVNRTLTSNDQGLISLSKLSIGSHKIVVYNPSTAESQEYTIKVVSRVTNNNNIVVDYNMGSKYTVRVYDDDGDVASGVVVVFRINGKTLTARSDKNGYASVVISEAPKSYTITATYAGQTVTNNVVVKQTLKAVKSLTTVKKTAKKLVLKASLKTSSGKGIGGKKITFKINGKKYTGKTNSKGIAKVTIKKNVIKKLKKGRKYAVTLVYLKETAKCSVKVKK